MSARLTPDVLPAALPQTTNTLSSSLWLTATTAPATAALDRSEIPATCQPAPPLPSALQTWAVERSSASPAAVRIIPGSWTTARRPLQTLSAASHLAVKPAALKTLVVLLHTVCPDPAKDLAIFLRLPSSLALASQHPTDP